MIMVSKETIFFEAPKPDSWPFIAALKRQIFTYSTSEISKNIATLQNRIYIPNRLIAQCSFLSIINSLIFNLRSDENINHN
ncbi:hypothetical protein BpHYR1_016578 [Brachionus plicatilis]|uniref:Uncharacterized protein n=1 Tax=Brachionus plicatilis TaxID=10195 RepID=A0A3M7QM21_BRAPC|nr:hypothetical protein BpHYR1_016578 [Brachionus plicatilis]